MCYETIYTYLPIYLLFRHFIPTYRRSLLGYETTNRNCTGASLSTNLLLIFSKKVNFYRYERVEKERDWFEYVFKICIRLWESRKKIKRWCDRRKAIEFTLNLKMAIRGSIEDDTWTYLERRKTIRVTFLLLPSNENCILYIFVRSKVRNINLAWFVRYNVGGRKLARVVTVYWHARHDIRKND